MGKIGSDNVEVKVFSKEAMFRDVKTHLNDLGISIPKFSTEDQRVAFFGNLISSFECELLNRISLIVGQAKYYLFEKEYTEHAWKELYAMHYSNTSYALSNKVMRVHFWNSEFVEDSDKDDYLKNGYLGYITLRPVPDFNLMLSYVVPNWKVLSLRNHNAWIMTYERNVHIFGYSICISTIPFYCQDTVYIRCAHADMLMFSTFLHHSYNFPRLSITDMVESNRYYPIPNGGLEYDEILDIFYRNKIPVSYYYCEEGKDEEYRAVLDAHIESKLPVIIYKDNHVVLVIGHTGEKEKRYIIYDDSGYYLSKTIESINFVGVVSFDQLFYRGESNCIYMVAATYQRMYLNPQEYFMMLDEYLSFADCDEDEDFPQQHYRLRSLFVDNTCLKHFLKTKCIEQDDSKIVDRLTAFLETDQPHYLWYSEYCTAIGRFVFLADPTFPVNTRQIIFPYGMFICDPNGDGVSLLTKVN